MLRSEILEDFLDAREKLGDVSYLLSIDSIEIEDDKIDELQLIASSHVSSALKEVGKAIEFLKCFKE